MEEVETLASRFHTACADYDGPRPKCMLLHHTYVGSDADDVDHAAQEFSRFYNYFGAWFQNKRPVRQGLIESLSDAEMAGNAMMCPANMRRDRTMGTADEVVDLVKRYEDLGYDEFSFWIDSGVSAERKRASLSRFIDDVMTRFQ